MTARIFRPTKSATQSGQARTHKWLLVYPQATARHADPLMGWTASDDMQAEVKLSFDTKEEAIAYAERNGVAYVVEAPAEKKVHIVSYSDNFRSDRIVPWTH